MEQVGKVLQTGAGGEATVMILRQSACSGDCHKCAGCGAVEQKLLLEARNPIGAAVGDTVTVTAGSGPVLAAAAVLYLLPVLLFFGGWLAGLALWQKGGLGGLCGFLLGLALAIAYDRCVAGKKKTEYTITGFVHRDAV